MTSRYIEMQERYSKRMFPRDKGQSLIDIMTNPVPYRRLRKGKPQLDIPPPPRISEVFPEQKGSSQLEHSGRLLEERYSKKMFPQEERPTLIETMNNPVPYRRQKKEKPEYETPPPPRISKVLAQRNNSSQMGAVMNWNQGAECATVSLRVKVPRSNIRRNASDEVHTVMTPSDSSRKPLPRNNQQPRKKITLLDESPDFSLSMSGDSILTRKLIPGPGGLTFFSRSLEGKCLSTMDCKTSDVAPKRMLRGQGNKKAVESPACDTFELVKTIDVYNPILHLYSRVPVFRIPNENLWQTKKHTEYSRLKKNKGFV